MNQLYPDTFFNPNIFSNVIFKGYQTYVICVLRKFPRKFSYPIKSNRVISNPSSDHFEISIGKIINDEMNNRTFVKEPQISNRFIDLLNKQRIMVPLT